MKGGLPFGQYFRSHQLEEHRKLFDTYHNESLSDDENNNVNDNPLLIQFSSIMKKIMMISFHHMKPNILSQRNIGLFSKFRNLTLQFHSSAP